MRLIEVVRPVEAASRQQLHRAGPNAHLQAIAVEFQLVNPRPGSGRRGFKGGQSGQRARIAGASRID